MLSHVNLPQRCLQASDSIGFKPCKQCFAITYDYIFKACLLVVVAVMVVTTLVFLLEPWNIFIKQSVTCLCAVIAPFSLFVLGITIMVTGQWQLVTGYTIYHIILMTLSCKSSEGDDFSKVFIFILIFILLPLVIPVLPLLLSTRLLMG